MSQNNFDAHANQTKLDYSSRRIINVQGAQYKSGKDMVKK